MYSLVRTYNSNLYKFLMFRFSKNETTTIVRVKPTSDPETTFVSFTVCPSYHSAYKRDVLETYNLSVSDYRDKNAIWYPNEEASSETARQFYHNITYEIDEVIEKIKISTMSLITPKVEIKKFNNFKQKFVRE